MKMLDMCARITGRVACFDSKSPLPLRFRMRVGENTAHGRTFQAQFGSVQESFLSQPFFLAAVRFEISYCDSVNNSKYLHTQVPGDDGDVEPLDNRASGARPP